MPFHFCKWLMKFQRHKKPTLAMEANRFAISARDCEEATKYLEALLELKQKDNDSGTGYYFVHQEGLLIASIISYSRAFTESRATPSAVAKARVDLGKVFGYDKSRIDLHKLILKKRHKMVAHSDWEYRHTRLLEVRNNNEVLREHSVVNYSQGIDIEKFCDMAEAMKNYFRAGMFDRNRETGK